MNTKTYGKGAVIFRQGDPGDCMYRVQIGEVGVYSDYQKPEEKKVAALTAGQLFGEMSLLDQTVRSTTVVSLSEDTVLEVISEEDFGSLFEQSPDIVLELATQMCHRLRNTTREYVEACRTVSDTMETEKRGGVKSEGLMERIKKFCAVHLGSKK